MKAIRRLGRHHWLAFVNLFWIIYAGLPWLAPVLMHVGADGPGKAVYAFYSTQCHQLAQRSFFLFGEQPMYATADLQAIWPAVVDPSGLREILGNEEMGWKVAWSDRMAAMYTATLIFGLLFALVRRQVRPISIWMFLLLLAPTALDGGTHLVSDLARFDQGFRATNVWLAELTGHRISPSFYVGHGLGSFNSWMRLLTGGLFGLGLVWFVYPHLEAIIKTSRSKRTSSKR
ncbi:MAG: DUF2085 domain-containing protein [Anaerolineae bacterium]|jgi:uncharacterized membrane protein